MKSFSPSRADPLRGRMISLMVFCVVLAGSVLGRAVYIQIVRDPRLESMARKQFQSKVLIRPRRGAILDRNGEALAINLEIKSLAADPSKIQNKRILARLLAKAVDVPASKILERLKGQREFAWIKRHLEDREIDRMRKFGIIDPEGDLTPGLWMVKESKRVYPHGELAAHVLGSVNLDSEGLEGVELWGNEQLQGKIVSLSAIKDALGRPTFIDTSIAKDMRDGEPVALTIDASLQYSVEEELKAAVTKTGSRAGNVIVMNAVTGELLAMANEPAFNPNDNSSPAGRRRNRVLTDGYEPGSTMKAVLLSSALSHGWRITDQVWAERGSFYVQGKRISEAEAHEKFGWLSLKRILQVSSNVGAAKVALKLGADRYLATLKTFGFGAKTGTGFPGEIPGQVPQRKAWQPLTLANIGFGQGILVTPMQMARAYAVFLNGGWLVQPTLLKTQIPGFKPEAPRRILPEKIAAHVVEALRGVVDPNGTGMKASLDGYVVAGKTGTAQEVEPGTGHYSRTRHVSSFIGFAVGVEPKLVIFASLDEPHGVYYASETAAPLFRNVLNAVATRFSLPAKPDALKRTLAEQMGVPEKDVPEKEPELKDRVQVSAAAPAIPLEWQGTATDGTLMWKMPSLEGLSAREAIGLLAGHRFQLELHGSGVVHHQMPAPGKTLNDGAMVRLTLGDP